LSYPVGHLSTMWWLGVRPGDVHLNISSPGWGKHAWSNFFSPFLAQATVFVFNYDRFDAGALMKVMDTHDVTSFCAPPTVWRMLIQADLTGESLAQTMLAYLEDRGRFETARQACTGLRHVLGPKKASTEVARWARELLEAA